MMRAGLARANCESAATQRYYDSAAWILGHFSPTREYLEIPRWSKIHELKAEKTLYQCCSLCLGV